MFSMETLFFSKWSRVMMLKLSEDVGLRDDGLNGCHLEPTMHRDNRALSSDKLWDSKVTALKNGGCNGVSAPPKFMNTLLVKFHTVFLPELSKGPLVRNTRWMTGGHNVLESVASRHRTGLHGRHKGGDAHDAPCVRGRTAL